MRVVRVEVVARVDHHSERDDSAMRKSPIVDESWPGVRAAAVDLRRWIGSPRRRSGSDGPLS